MRRLVAVVLALLLGDSVAAACARESSPVDEVARSRHTSAASPPARGLTPLDTCPPGSTPDLPGARGQGRPAYPYRTTAAFDRHAGRIVALVRSEENRDAVHTWTFDVCTNTWRAMHPPVEPELPAPSVPVAYADAAAVTVAFPPRDLSRPWVYSLERNLWVRRPADPHAPPGSFSPHAAVYDSRTRTIVLRDAGSGELRSYDVTDNRWAVLRQRRPIPLDGDRHSLLAYDRRTGRIVLVLFGDLVSPGVTWRFTPSDGTWRRGAVPPELNLGYFESGYEVTYDEVSGQTVVFSDGVLATYDDTADRWTVRSGDSATMADTGSRNRLGHAIVYDAVNGRVVLFGGGQRMPDGWELAPSVLAVRPSTGAWTELLAD